MRAAAARAASALLVVLFLAGALAAVQAGAPRGTLAQTSGSSGSGSSGNGSSGNGSSAGSDAGAGGSGQGGEGGEAGGGGGGQTPPRAGSSGSGSSGSGSGSVGDPGGDQDGGGTGEESPGDGDGPGGTAAPSTTAPVAIPSPSTATSVPAARVGDGRRVDCGPDADPGMRCFEVDDPRGVDAVRIPDGLGGFVIVPIVAVPAVVVDTGASTSAASNVDLRVGVNERTGEVVRVERRTDPVRQRGFATLAFLMLVVSTSVSIATWLRLRKLGRDR